MIKMKKYILPKFKNTTQSVKKQIVLLIIFFVVLNGERMHYIAVKNWPALLRVVTSKHNGGYYCLSSLHSFR